METLSPWLNDIFRWAHVVAGVLWIGLLYFFNWVNAQVVPHLDGETKQMIERLENVSVYVHQMAMDGQGDIYIASVYPEHGGEARGIAGPSFLRWSPSIR